MINPNVAYLQTVTVAQIREFTIAKLNQHKGLALVFTPQQRRKCQLQLELIQERQAHLMIQDIANQRSLTIDKLNDTIKKQRRDIEQLRDTIKDQKREIHQQSETTQNQKREIQQLNDTIQNQKREIHLLRDTTRDQKRQIAHLDTTKFRQQREIEQRRETIRNQIIEIEQLRDTTRDQKRKLETPFYFKGQFLVGLLITIVGFATGLSLGWKKPEQEGFGGLLAAAIVTGIIALIWVVLIIIKIRKKI